MVPARISRKFSPKGLLLVMMTVLSVFTGMFGCIAKSTFMCVDFRVLSCNDDRAVGLHRYVWMYSEVDLHACGISWVDLNFPNASYRGAAGIAHFRAGLQAASILEKGVEGGVTCG